MISLKNLKHIKRLKHLYGVVALDQNKSILKLITGEKILELGCGYGTFIQDAFDSGKEVMGLDIDGEVLKTARLIYPYLNTRLIRGDMKLLPLKNKSFHTVILRESLHHVEWEDILPEIFRVAQREIIVFEPNPNWLLRICRKIICHKDQEISPKLLIRILKNYGITVKGLYFRDIIAFPLSGGFVGWELFPPLKFLYPAIIWVDRIFQHLFHFLKMDRALSWRYIMKCVLENHPEEKR